MAQILDLRASSYQALDLSVFGSEVPVPRRCPRVSLTINTGQNQLQLDAFVVPVIASNVAGVNRRQLTSLFPKLSTMNLAPQCEGTSYDLDVLIGADNFWSIAGGPIVRLDNGPVCIPSRLGYLLSGPVNCPNQPSVSGPKIDQVLSNISSTTSIDVSQYWTLESLGLDDDSTASTDLLSDFDLKDYTNNHIRWNEGRYEADLPWNECKQLLPTNYITCIRQTRQMFRKMPPAKLAAYHDILCEQSRRNFIEPVPKPDSTRGHYLCHYGVEKNSSSTPLRIVYRCNFKTGQNPSLNDCLHPGLPLIQDLGGISMRMRLFDVVLCADIEKAFLNIDLSASDRDFTKFLALSDPTDPESPLQELQFKSILFGATSSPFILHAVLRKHLFSLNTPMSTQLIRDTYVDNVLTSVPDYATARTYYTQANESLAKAGFNLRCWTSNHASIQARAQSDGRLSSESPNRVNTLGMLWNSQTDTLACKPLSNLDAQLTTTAKLCLSETARLFDVPGFLLPVHVQAKLFLQDLQKKQRGWRESLTPEECESWKKIHDELRTATQIIKWNRQAVRHLTPATPLELHIFTDASVRSFGSVAYLVANKQSSIFWAKNKLTPLKEEARIPRLELNSCLLGAQLLTYIKKNISDYTNISKTILWSDSQIALWWIKSSDKKKLDRYVRNRVEKIKQAGFMEMRYCPTNENPSDLLTRGISATKLKNSELWWNGPPWLTTGQYPACPTITAMPIAAQKPTLPTIPEADDENAADNDDVPPDGDSNTRRPLDPTAILLPERHSTLRKLIITTLCVRKFTENILQRIKPTSVSKPIKTKVLLRNGTRVIEVDRMEFEETKFQWILRLQHSHFRQELEKIQQDVKGPLTKQLKLYQDQTGVIRKGSRMEHARLTEDCKHPILLPSKSHFTDLIIRHAHARCLHMGIEATVALLRQTYWIPHIQNTVRKLLRQCITCNKVNSRPYKMPISPPLPNYRLDTTKPAFHTTGVDYTGNITVRDRQGNLDKVYIVLYTCAVSRAVHTVKSFLESFTRFTSRKSMPAHIISDNGSYFHGAANHLKQVYSDPAVRMYMAERNTKWTFIPSRAPWFGGMWERCIGTVKRCLCKVLGKALVTEQELYTVLTKIEAILNDRPLTRNTSDPQSISPITPSHLVYGRRLTTIPQCHLEEDDYHPPSVTISEANRRLAYLQSLVDNYWKRFTAEYLPALRDSHRLRNQMSPNNNIRPGDVVLIHDDIIKRPLWKMAIIEKINLSQDGLMRSAILKTKNGLVSRPISKLYPIELSTDMENEQIERIDKEAADPVQERPLRQAATRAIEKIKQIHQLEEQYE